MTNLLNDREFRWDFEVQELDIVYAGMLVYLFEIKDPLSGYQFNWFTEYGKEILSSIVLKRIKQNEFMHKRLKAIPIKDVPHFVRLDKRERQELVNNLRKLYTQLKFTESGFRVIEGLEDWSTEQIESSNRAIEQERFEFNRDFSWRGIKDTAVSRISLNKSIEEHFWGLLKYVFKSEEWKQIALTIRIGGLIV